MTRNITGKKLASRERAIDACDVANDLVGDLITATNVLRHYRTMRVDAMLMVGIQRMCISQMVLACSKFKEFYEKFSDLMTDAHRAEAKSMLKEFRTRRIADFRNKVIGHIWDKDRDRPLYLSEVTRHIEEFAGGNDLDGLLNWINRTDSSPGSVSYLANAIRDELATRFAIRPEDVIKR